MALRSTLVLGLALGLLAEGKPGRVVIHPNSSIDIASIAGAPDGDLWLAAADGLYRFDGIHYHKIESYPSSSADFVAFTNDGTLWIGAKAGLYRYRGTFQSVLPEQVVALAAGSDEVFARTGQGLLRVSGDGRITRITPAGDDRLFVNSAGELWYAFEGAIVRLPKGAQRADRIAAVPPGLAATHLQPMVDGSGRLWIADTQRAVTPDMTLEQSRRGAPAITPLLAPGRNGQIWFLASPISGILDNPAFDHQTRGPVSTAFETPDRRLWFKAFRQGLGSGFSDESWEIWRSGKFSFSSIAQSVRTPRGDSLLSTHGAEIFQFDPVKRNWLRTAAPKADYFCLLPLPGSELLASTRDRGLLHLSAAGAIRQRIHYTRPKAPVEENHREIFQDARDRIWVANKLALFRLEGPPGNFSLRKVALPYEGRLAHPADLEVDSIGRTWVGYNTGLAWLDTGDVWRRIPTDRPLDAIRSFTFGGKGDGAEIWVAYRAKGRFSLLLKSGETWKVNDFTTEAGYPSESTYFLKRDSRGWIWRGTNDGVYVSDGRHFAPHEWLHLSVRSGFPEGELDQFGFREDADRSIWLSAEQGVARLTPDAGWFLPVAGPPPRVTRLRADGLARLDIEGIPRELPSGVRQLEIDIGSFAASPVRDAPFFYRLTPGSPEWRPAPGGTIRASNLPPGDHRWDVSFAGTPPETVLAFSLRIAPAPLQFSWQWSLAAMVGLGGIWPIARRTLAYQKLRYRLARLAYRRRRRKGLPVEDSPGDDLTALCGQLLVDRYLLVRPISRGGFSTVFEGQDTHQPNTPVAVKILGRRITEHPWVKGRFAHEVAALRLVRHPGVVPMLDSWVNPDGHPCLVAPLLEGPTLRQALDEGGPIPPERAAGLIEKIGEALGEVHRRGVVHRDLKPENILLSARESGEEQPVLIDFGNAGLLGGEEGLGKTRLLTGSPPYMAPEQLTHHYSAASDTYSYGVVVFEMLTGKLLADLRHSPQTPEFEEELAASLTAAPVAPARLLARELGRAFAADPAARPADVQAWAAALGEILRREA